MMLAQQIRRIWIKKIALYKFAYQINKTHYQPKKFNQKSTN